MSENSKAGRHAAQTATKSRFRRPRSLVIVGLIVAAVVAAVVFALTRSSPDESATAVTAPRAPDGRYQTIPDYLVQNGISATPVFRGEPGAPVITFTVPPDWSDAGPDAPPGAYGAAFYDNSVDQENPASIVVLLSKLGAGADPAKIMEYATGELENLPDYKEVSPPKNSTLSGFEAIQLGGLYTRNGAERIIAQKTVVIPVADGLFVLQMNADAPKEEAPVLQEVTAVLDEESTITP